MSVGIRSNAGGTTSGRVGAGIEAAGAMAATMNSSVGDLHPVAVERSWEDPLYWLRLLPELFELGRSPVRVSFLVLFRLESWLRSRLSELR